MPRRTLDAGQCTACQPRNLKVDEWSGSFDGEQRRKLEIAIDPVLRRVDALLGQAEDRTGALKLAAGGGGFREEHADGLQGARDDLDAALAEVQALRGRTADTPYAFIGLQ